MFPHDAERHQPLSDSCRNSRPGNTPGAFNGKLDSVWRDASIKTIDKQIRELKPTRNVNAEKESCRSCWIQTNLDCNYKISGLIWWLLRDFCLVPDQSENCNFNPILVSFIMIQKTVSLCFYIHIYMYTYICIFMCTHKY